MRRKEAFDRLLNPIWEPRQKYRQALSLKCGNSSPWADSQVGPKKRVNYSHRYLRWLTAQSMGEKPVIKSPRDAEGDEVLAEMVDLVLERVLDEGGALEEWRDTYADKCWLGCSTVWYGFHAEVLAADEARGASEGAGERAERALQGGLEPNPGQDHVSAAAGLRAVAEEQGAELGQEGRQALIAAAQAHDQARVDEEEAGQSPRIENRQIWFKRGLPGVDTFWDAFATDMRDAEWMCQRVLMRVEDAKRYGGFRRGARSRLEGTTIGSTTQRDGREVTNGDGIPGGENEVKRCIIYIFWDKRHRTRHFISPEIPNEYLEVDESNPYVDDAGNDLIPDFFPCAYSAPEKPPVEGGTRVFGMPLIATGWAQEDDADTFNDLMISAAKRGSQRHYLLNRSVLGKDYEAVARALESGKDHLAIGVDIEPSLMDKAVIPLAFRGTTGEIEGQSRHAQSQWVQNQAMPHAELSSRPQAGTATQEEIGVAAGRNEAEDIVKADERAFAKMVEGVRGLVRGFYPDEKILALLGPSWLEKFDAWKASALDGDKLDIKFGPRALREENVKLSLLQKTFELAQNYTGPLGLPIHDLRPIIEEIFRKLGMGTLREVAPEAMQMRQLVEILSEQIEELQEENQALAKQAGAANKPAQPKSGGKKKPGPKPKNRSGGSNRTTSDSMNSAVRRGTGRKR